jgi:hypothetical protein
VLEHEPTITVFRCGQNDCRFDTVVMRGWHDLKCASIAS